MNIDQGPRRIRILSGVLLSKERAEEMRKITAELLAAIVAYPMTEAGFTADQRQKMAEVFAVELGIKQTDRFFNLCKRESEKEEAA